MARLDGLIRELTQEESRRLFRTYLLEFAELSSQVHSLKSGRAQAESERDDLRGELTRVKKTVEVRRRLVLQQQFWCPLLILFVVCGAPPLSLPVHACTCSCMLVCD